MQKPYKESLVYNIEKVLYYQKHILNTPGSSSLKDEEIEYRVAMIRESIGG